MPPKRRSIKSEYAKIALVDSECQTELYDEEFQQELLKISALRRRSSTCAAESTNVEDNGDSATVPQSNPHVLYVQLRACTRIIAKLSADSHKSRADNARIISFFGEIFRLVRAMKGDYDSILQTTRDSVKAMGANMMRYVSDVSEIVQKQKTAAEEDRRRYKQKLKSKDLQIEHLQEKLRESNEYVTTVVETLEAEQRRVTIAEREMHACREKVREVNNKLSDQLFLAGNQKCMSCQANEKVREMLSNEVAEKTNTANVFHQKYVEIEAQLAQQKRVNEMLSRAVDKHSFAERAIRGEFERIKGEYNNLIGETRALRAQVKLTDTSAASSIVTITPPNSEKSTNSKDDSSKSSLSDACEPGEIVSTSPYDHELILARRIVRRPTKFNKTGCGGPAVPAHNNNLKTNVNSAIGPSVTTTETTAKVGIQPSAKVAGTVSYALKPLSSSSILSTQMTVKSGPSMATDAKLTSTSAASKQVVKTAAVAKPSTVADVGNETFGNSSMESSETVVLEETATKTLADEASTKKLADEAPSTSTASETGPARLYSNSSSQGESVAKKLRLPAPTNNADTPTALTSTAGAILAAATANMLKFNNADAKKPTVSTTNNTNNNNRKRGLVTPNVKPVASDKLMRKTFTPPQRPVNVQKTRKPGNFFQPTSAASIGTSTQGLPLLGAALVVSRHQHAHQQRIMEARRLAALQEEAAIRTEQQHIARERQMIQARREAQQMEMLREQQLRQRIGAGPNLNNNGRLFGGSPPCDMFGRPLPPRPPAGMPRPPEPPRHGGTLPWHSRPAAPQQQPPWMRQPPFGRRP